MFITTSPPKLAVSRTRIVFPITTSAVSPLLKRGRTVPGQTSGVGLPGTVAVAEGAWLGAGKLVGLLPFPPPAAPIVSEVFAPEAFVLAAAPGTLLVGSAGCVLVGRAAGAVARMVLVGIGVLFAENPGAVSVAAVAKDGLSLEKPLSVVGVGLAAGDASAATVSSSGSLLSAAVMNKTAPPSTMPTNNKIPKLPVNHNQRGI